MNRHPVCATFVATIGATLALASTPAMAGKPGGGGTGTYNPEIAYTSNQGTTWSVYLANADGTNPVAVYTKRSGGGVGSVDFVPGSGPTGGKLVFQPTLGSISVLTYTAGTGGITVSRIDPLVTEPGLGSSLDVSPDGQYVLYKVGNTDSTATLKVIPIGGGDRKIVSTGYYAEAVWSRDLPPKERRIAVRIGYSVNPNTGGLPRIETFTLNPDFSFLSTSGPIYGPCTDCTSIAIEFARTQDNVLFGVAGGASPGMWDVPASGGALAPYGAGSFPCFNSNDSQIYYKNGGSVIYRFNVLTGISTSTQVSAGSVNQFDVRP